MHSGKTSNSISRPPHGRSTYSILIIILSGMFSILFSYYSILKAYTINAYGWDLGLYSQAFYSAIHGRLFYTNLAGGSFLAEHFSPLMFAILPFFYLYPSPYTLLVLQSIFISFAAVPLYYLSLVLFSRAEKIGKIKKPELYAFIISLAFLLSPLTESPVYFDFHIMVFLPFFYFMSVYFFLQRKLFLNIIFLALIASIHSSFIFIVIMMVIMEFIMWYKENHRESRDVRRWAIFSVSGIAILIIYYIIAGIVKGDINHSTTVSLFVSGESGAASRSLEGLVITLIYNPVKFINYVISNYEIKILFLLLAFMAVDFASIDSPAGLLPAIPYLAYAMTSSYIPYYFIGYQYSMMFIPVVFVSGSFGIEKLMELKQDGTGRKRFKFRNIRNTFIAITAFAIASFIVVSPISPMSLEPSAIHSIYNDSRGYMERENQFMYSLAKDVNMNATLVTGNSLYPLFYSDMNATAFPYGNISMDSNYTYLIANFNDSQTYLNDGNNISLSGLASAYMNSGSYGIIAEGYGIIALEYHYRGIPLLTGPFSVNYRGSLFNVTGNIITGPFPDKGLTSFQELDLEGSNIHAGNSTYLLPGNYTYKLSFNNTSHNPLKQINITICGDYGKTIIANISGSRENITGNELTFNLSTPYIYTGVIYRIDVYSNDYTLYNMSVSR
ncbi:MAG: DUF2079 domain-containing protein [Ferroplasma sp.]|uniref:DUF2079 domain-containing protein n=1 Tax=Ferroplasma sp. TaxID=2591003 RepID=UPI0028169D93|nr:DUF2079 domain-containing protein [Ferroplasma sp.]WMT50454.1 MAG: DUF2079 domain-containing protein [Ferroplasma sp.]